MPRLRRSVLLGWAGRVVTPCALAVVLVASAAAVLAAPALCAAAGYTMPKPMGTAIQCTGGCPDGSNCPQGTNGAGPAAGTHIIWGAYTYCACPGEPESNCCHLIRRSAGSSPVFVGIGDCLAQSAGCPPGNTCTTNGNGAPASPFVVDCDPAMQ